MYLYKACTNNRSLYILYIRCCAEIPLGDGHLYVLYIRSCTAQHTHTSIYIYWLDLSSWAAVCIYMVACVAARKRGRTVATSAARSLFHPPSLRAQKRKTV